jgi:hypothetical protein
MFAIFTEHDCGEGPATFDRDTMVSASLLELVPGMMLISCGDGPTHWRLHSVHTSLEEAQKELGILTMPRSP